MIVPKGLETWAKRVEPILKKPFPPSDAPKRTEIPLWDKISTWSMLCEEILDTTPEPSLLAQYYQELVRRGFTDDTIQEMRRFAWMTVGWLNFEKALWEWVHLDEEDIKRAIDWQEKDGLIDSETARSMIQYMTDKLGRG